MAKPYNLDDTLKQRFEYADNRMPTSMTQDNQTYYLHYNQVGTLRLVTDINHNIIKEITYDTFGNILHDTNTDPQIPFGFAGGLYDRDTKFVHFGYREYDPFTGKWTAKDPIGFDGGDSNLYGYVLQDPVNFIDPEGLSGTGLPWTKEPPYVTGGKGGNLNPNLPWHVNVNPITGYTKHGLNQSIGRNGGIGVKPKAILDAVKCPTKPPKNQKNGAVKYTGKDATVIVNKKGKVITTWSKNKKGTRK